MAEGSSIELYFKDMPVIVTGSRLSPGVKSRMSDGFVV